MSPLKSMGDTQNFWENYFSRNTSIFRGKRVQTERRLLDSQHFPVSKEADKTCYHLWKRKDDSKGRTKIPDDWAESHGELLKLNKGTPNFCLAKLIFDTNCYGLVTLFYLPFPPLMNWNVHSCFPSPIPPLHAGYVGTDNFSFTDLHMEKNCFSGATLNRS